MPAEYYCDVCGKKIGWDEHYNIRIEHTHKIDYSKLYKNAYLCKNHLKILIDNIERRIKNG